jgi:hypothetical protein
VLNRIYLRSIALKRRATACISYQVTISFNNGLSWQIGSLKLYAKIRGGRFQYHIHLHAGMNTGTGNTCLRLESMLPVRIEICSHILTNIRFLFCSCYHANKDREK